MAEARDDLRMGRASDGRLVARPISPHLQVYRPQISSALSIFHRATGIAVSAGTLLMTWWLVAAATSDAAFARAQGFIASPLGLLMLFGWTLSLAYHFFAGLRHLAWDAGYGFDKPTYVYTGYAVLVATVVATLVVFGAGLASR